AQWVPYNKGGKKRDFYGNNDYIIDFSDGGKPISEYRKSKGQSYSLPGKDNYFKESITWSLITASGFSMRYREAGSIFDVAGMSAFSSNKLLLKYILGLMMTKLADYVFDMINPTLNLQAGDLKKMPIYIEENSKDKVAKIIDNSIEISKKDWNNFETAWNFDVIPLIKYQGKSKLIKDSYYNFVNETDNRFNQLKENKVELNRTFINIYELQDELSPEVVD